MFFNNNSTYPVGLDISDLSLKLVQLNKRGDKIKIQAIGKTDLPSGLIEDGEIKNKDKVINEINKLISAPGYGKVTSNEVIACLPETKTFIKLIEIAKTPNPLAEIIEGEIEKHVPMAIEEIYYDWQIIENKLDKQRVLIGAAPLDIVNQYIDLLDGAKLSTTALEIEPISLCRALLAEENPKSKNKKNDNCGILDIGAKRTSMTIYSKNTILFTLSMPISGEKITNNIAETLKIELKQAEKAKIICGLDKGKAQGIIKNILSGMIEELIKKINEAIEFYQNHYPGNGPLNKILLCGGGANIKNLSEIIGQATGVEVKKGDALINLAELSENFSKILTETHKLKADFIKDKNNGGREKIISVAQDTSLTYATAIGLGLRGIFIDEI